MATVSRVLNHPESVAPRTKAKIEAVIKEAGYTPNWFARGLNLNRTDTIAVIIPDVLSESYMYIAKGVEDVAHQKDCMVLMCNAEFDAEKERRYLDNLIKRKVDGVIMISTLLDKEDFLNIAEENLPIVLIGSNKEAFGLPCVSVDTKEAAYVATKHLIDNGYRKIAFIQGKLATLSNEWKLEGYKRALSEAGIDFVDDYIYREEESIYGGYLAAKKILNTKNRPDAAFATRDALAFGVIDGMRDSGIAIPDEMALVGFDNVQMAGVVDPPLTTMDMSMHKLGVVGARLLFDIIADNEDRDPQTIFLQSKLKIRKSSGHKEKIGEMFK